ncbi:MAG: methyltransferase [Oligoflexus sp.]|nr:methyltransferase [Oligoflexus sp.]
MTDKARIRSIIHEVTEAARPPLVPELQLALVTAASPWWSMNPSDLQSQGIPEPFWAFAWAGGQSLARFILDHPHYVAGKPVIDFGAGGGIVSLAALKAGASHVTATEIDPWAIVACEVNLESYRGQVDLSCEDWIGRQLPLGSILLCGDMSYERELCDRLLVWFGEQEDCTILIGDPGRGFIAKDRFEELATYLAPTDSDSDGRYKVRASVLLWKNAQR